MSPLTSRSRASLAVILAIIALILSALYAAGLAFDWPSWLRGSNWVWVRRVPEAGPRLLLMAAALAAGLAFGARALRGGAWSRRTTAVFLGALVVLTPLLQIAVAAQHRAQPLSLMTTGATGFWQEGVRIANPGLFVGQHEARMPGYADVHVRTQPPGWPLVYWATARAFAGAPAAADAVGRWIHRYDCLAPELMGLDAAQLAAGSVRVLILLLSGLGVLPLYAIGRRFYSADAARLSAVGFAFLPGLLVFSGRFDVAYALLGLLALWLALLAAGLGGRGDGVEPGRGNRPAAVALAVSLAAASFLSFTALAVGGFVMVVAATCALAQRDVPALRRLVLTGAGVAAAVVLFWGGLWAMTGADGLGMWRVGQEIHREFRLNYPVWFLFNLYDTAVFMGVVPFVGALGAAAVGLRRDGDAPGRGLALGWLAAVLLLNLSATVRAETGRLWLFVMPLGLLVGLAFFAGAAGRERWRRGRLLALFGVFLVQALVTGYLLGGRAGLPSTPAPLWRLPASATAVDVRLGDSVALRGYEAERTAEGLRLRLYWRAADFPRAEYSVFVHALDAAGEIVGQSDGPPAAVPMWCWVPGEFVADERLLTAPGAESVGVGLYDPVTGHRLPLSPPSPDDRLLLPLPVE